MNWLCWFDTTKSEYTNGNFEAELEKTKFKQKLVTKLIILIEHYSFESPPQQKLFF